MDLLESSDSESVDGGVALDGDHTQGFRVNEDYAKRFEYNKKREELAQCECPRRLSLRMLTSLKWKVNWAIHRGNASV